MGQAIGVQVAVLPKPCRSRRFTITYPICSPFWKPYSPSYYLLTRLFRLRAPDHALAQLFDSAEPVPFQTIREMIRSELGEWPENIFIEFDEKPLGSAVCLLPPPLVALIPHNQY